LIHIGAIAGGADVALAAKTIILAPPTDARLRATANLIDEA
jgi:hypothetical protein